MSTALRIRFERTGNLIDLNDAVDASRDGVAASPVGRPDSSGCLAALGAALQDRFDRTGNLADLDGAIDASRNAVAATPTGDPDRVGYLSNLGIALRTRFQRTGNLADLDAAIDAGQAAVDAAPAGHLNRAILASLCSSLRVRFTQAGGLADLDAAIGAGQAAVDATPTNHPDRSGYLSNLAIALRDRFDRTGDVANLDAAIDACQAAVDATPADHPNRAIFLSNLGSALATRFERTGGLADLDAAIGAGQAAVDATPASHPSRAHRLSNRMNALHRRFERTGNLADLDDAVDLGRDAVESTPDDHPDLASYLFNLGTALGARFERTGDLADLDAAINVGRQAFAIESAPPRVRAGAARKWGHAAAAGGRWAQAMAGFEAAIGLLGRVAPRNLARGDQEHLLNQLGWLGSEAAACCVHAGLPDRAVELFEQGRGVLLSQALDTRTSLTILTEQHPDLAMRFAVLSEDLDRAGGDAGRPMALPVGTGGASMAHGDAEARRKTAEAFDRVIAEIRALPGFTDFLRTPPVHELAAAAVGGPVVLVSVSHFGSYAFILPSNGTTEPVSLPGLTPDTVRERVTVFLAAFAVSGDEDWAEQQVATTLEWLWDVLAAPVLDRLGISGPPRDGQPWPRLWWCLSGLLSFLPVHAAGHHDTRHDAVPATVIDRVVSSYTPTVRALAHARRSADNRDRGGVAGPGGRQVVAVAMPHTPGASDLPGAQAEAAGLQRRFCDRITVLSGAHATHETVLAALPGARWAHFACHGAANMVDPSASHLLLADHEDRLLTVVDVARLRLNDAELAFLSACSTAQPGARLADEAIHLASAFQLAGYRHVIGTLWPIGDKHAVDIADDIYTTLTAGGDVAGAVHAATCRLRNRWADTPSVWASHIHVGA